MIGKKEIIEEIQRLSSLRSAMETYEELAATGMQSTRGYVLRNRDFIMEINSIFQEVKSSYKNELASLMRKKKIKDPTKLTLIGSNGKKLFVLISANTGLYGDIIQKTFNLFKEFLRKDKGDVAIIGKTGLELFKKANINSSFVYFDVSDNKMDNAALKKVVTHLIQYEQVLVFYGQFKNTISQEPIVTSVSGDPLPGQKEIQAVKYFFEPSLEKIIVFFEKEIFVSIFEQTLHESRLAKFASRMNALGIAVENIKSEIKKTTFDKSKIQHHIANRKQLETFSSMSLWKKT